LALRTTLIYALEATLAAVGTGLVLALLLEQKVWAQRLMRTLFYFPVTIPLIAVSWIFRIFLERDTGFLNILLLRLGLIASPVDWLMRFPRGSIVTLSFWFAGWCMLILLGGLSTIPASLYDAARIDGAGYFQRLRRITLPLLSPFVFFLLVVSLINSLQVFLQPYLLNPYRAPSGSHAIASAPPRETRFVMAEAYLIIIGDGNWGYGIALLWILFLTILMITILLYKLRVFWVYAETEDRRK
jgi:multiple sugar transport system permease protein